MIIRKIKNYLFAKKNIKVGTGTRILTSISNFGSEPYLVEIGDYCTITSGVKFITHDASIGIALNYKNQSRIIGEKKYELMQKIKINNNCMIGVNSIILPGVSIGPNSIVGSGSVVTKNVPEGVVVAGNPARIICSIDDYYQKINKKIFLVPITKSMQHRKSLILNALEQKKESNEK